MSTSTRRAIAIPSLQALDHLRTLLKQEVKQGGEYLLQEVLDSVEQQYATIPEWEFDVTITIRAQDIRQAERELTEFFRHYRTFLSSDALITDLRKRGELRERKHGAKPQ